MIELTFLIAFVVCFVIGFASVFEALNWFVGLISIICALVVAYMISPFSELVMIPLANTIWYGYAWGWLEWASMYFIICCIFLIGVVMTNLVLSKGKKPWG